VLFRSSGFRVMTGVHELFRPYTRGSDEAETPELDSYQR